MRTEALGTILSTSPFPRHNYTYGTDEFKPQLFNSDDFLGVFGDEFIPSFADHSAVQRPLHTEMGQHFNQNHIWKHASHHQCTTKFRPVRYGVCKALRVFCNSTIKNLNNFSCVRRRDFA